MPVQLAGNGNPRTRYAGLESCLEGLGSGVGLPGLRSSTRAEPAGNYAGRKANMNPSLEEGDIITCPHCGWDEAYIEHQYPKGTGYACDNCERAWWEDDCEAEPATQEEAGD